MRNPFFTFLCLFLTIPFAYNQCDIDFGSVSGQFSFSTVDGTDIVNGALSGANATSSQSFDIWDETTNDCSTPGGLDDITFDFEVIHAVDQYGIDGVIDFYGGDAHEIVQAANGLQGNNPFGSNVDCESSTGDVRGYRVTVTFAPHVSIIAGDVSVPLNRINTANVVYESASLVFLDETETPYGTATYDGFYDSGALPAGASNDNSCTAPAPTTPWIVSGNGVFTTNDVATVDITAPCNPTTGVNGTYNIYTVDPVGDTGLNTTDKIGGFVFTVYGEDVAASSAPGANTTTVSSSPAAVSSMTIADVSLPVEMYSFTAQSEKEQVNLQWTTASETDNDYFEIQHGIDGEHFFPLGRVDGVGSSSDFNAYSFIHRQVPKGTNYYRIKQVDNNGNFEFSKVVSVQVDHGQQKPILYPAIANDEIHLSIPQSNGVLNYQIFDIAGKLMKAGSFDGPSQENYSFNVSDLPLGSYFFQVNTSGSPEVLRFIKVH